MSFWSSAFGMRSDARHYSKRTFDWVLSLSSTWEIAYFSLVKNPGALLFLQRSSVEGAGETQTDEKLLRGTRIESRNQKSRWERTASHLRLASPHLANWIITFIPRFDLMLFVFLACSSEDRCPMSAGRSSNHINFWRTNVQLPVVLNFTHGHLPALTYFDKLRLCCMAAS